MYQTLSSLRAFIHAVSFVQNSFPWCFICLPSYSVFALEKPEVGAHIILYLRLLPGFFFHRPHHNRQLAVYLLFLSVSLILVVCLSSQLE